MIGRFIDWLFPPYVYGVCKGQKARRNRWTGAVQFVLWRAGEQGHVKDYWHDFDSSWWDQFRPDPERRP